MHPRLSLPHMRTGPRHMINTGEQADLPLVHGDKRRFLQVLINLVKNAIEYTPKGYIELKASYHDDENMLVVHV